ncbi:MAG: hypothetical protein ABI835_04550 [Chloroflexota bacterium]
MLRLMLKPLVLLVALSFALIGAAHSQSSDDRDLGTVILPSPECASPCWQGIEIGVTTRQQATEMLEAHPWVAQVYQTSLAVTWRWNGKQPARFNGDKDGLLQIGGGVVRQIRIQTLIPFGDVWLLLDRPDDARMVQPVSRFSAYQIAAYNVGIQAISTVDCPVTPETFWAATITLGMGEVWSTEALNSRSLNIYHLPFWWDRLRYC